MATAGSGDVLTGILTGLIAQGYSSFEASILGVYLHGKTADLAMNDLTYETFTASHIVDYLSDAIKDLLRKQNPIPQQEEEPEKEQKTDEDSNMYV